MAMNSDLQLTLPGSAPCQAFSAPCGVCNPIAPNCKAGAKFKWVPTLGTWFHLVCPCPLQNNVLLALKQVPFAQTDLVQTVCMTLSKIWGLEVLCECMTYNVPVCHGVCLSTTFRARGITLTVGGGGLARSHALPGLQPTKTQDKETMGDGRGKSR